MDRRSNLSSGAVRRDSSPRPADFSYPWFGSRRKLESAFESLFILSIYFRIKPRRPADSCLFFGSHQILCLYIAYFLFVQYFFSPKLESFPLRRRPVVLVSLAQDRLEGSRLVGSGRVDWYQHREQLGRLEVEYFPRAPRCCCWLPHRNLNWRWHACAFLVFPFQTQTKMFYNENFPVSKNLLNEVSMKLFNLTSNFGENANF